ncbi:hypothetical protein BGZ75_006992 [Mortierella antarctica]|nr:hypothetical protein BGZ75_006992 [Mortierella antarctica]
MHNKLPLEMLQSIGRFLNQSDLSNCTQVNKCWQAAYTPVLWCDLKLPGKSCQQRPLADALEKHKDLVRVLKVHDTLLYNCAEIITPAQFPSLQSLTVIDPSMDASTDSEASADASTWTSTDGSTTTEGDTIPFEPEQPFGVLLQLRRLDLENIHPRKIAWFLEPIVQFPHLRSLVITETKIDWQGALNLWKVFPQLETLKLVELDFLDLGAAREQMGTLQCPHLANLHLHIRDEAIPMGDQLLLIQACPTLKDFHWINVEGHEEYPFSDEFDEYRQEVVPDQLEKVEELEAAGALTDSWIALAMNTMPLIRSLTLTKNGLGPLSFQALQPYLTTLCRFDVQSFDVTSAMIQTILCSCPALQSLRAGVMSARDAITEDKEWACTSTLKVLSLSFRFGRLEAHLQDTLL